VAVTGLGPITAIGTGVESFWKAVIDGRRGARAVDFDWLDGRPFKCRVGAPCEDPDPETFPLTERQTRMLDPTARYALAASRMALIDAGIEPRLVDARRHQYALDAVDPTRAGVIIGTGIGGLCTIERSHFMWTRGDKFTGSNKFSLPMLIPNAIPAQVAISFGLKGECKTVVTACASGTMAIGDAYRLVRDGELDLAVCGGVEKTLSDFDGYGLMGFDMLNTLSTRNADPESASRPFDSDRDGFVLGEGAGILVLEREEHARARGARIYARISGYGATCDAHSMVQIEPSGEQMVRAMERALESTEVGREDVQYVNAHGTSTVRNDSHEAQALHGVFGRRVRDVLVNSTKAMTGHAIGASGAIEAITTTLSLFRGLVHRCVNLENPDPACDLNLPRENQRTRPAAAMSNSFAFGGHNASVVFESA
jgi:3-oxoacyl-[acyl-carrier-protein] synthase II